MKEFNPKLKKSLMLRAHCQTSGWSLTEQDPFNNITRTCVEASAAVFGGTQSLHTNSLDEAIALPTEFSARIARNTQLYLQHETKITKTVDPWGGSYYVENLTNSLVEKAWEHIEEIKSYGGMTKAIEKGIPKMRIEQSATKKQAKIDSKRDIIVGVNDFEVDYDEQIQYLEINNKKVKDLQIERLKDVKKNRDQKKVEESLTNLTKAASTNENLLALAVEAAKNRATIGEISTALEIVFSRYKAKINTFTGVYSKEIKNDSSFKEAIELADKFSTIDGRRPRILVAKMGQDGHDRGAKVVATSYADLGFDVDIGPLFQTPYEAAKQAIENDVHILGISSLAGGHKTLVPEVIKELKKYEREDIMVIVGGVIPKQDYTFLKDEGVTAIFGPGTKISETAKTILTILLNR
jgi:methylmalonyl-CoA mutase